MLDALVADVVEVHRRAERQPREDRHLGGGVAPLTSSLGSASA
jgi:hypothetical protein